MNNKGNRVVISDDLFSRFNLRDQVAFGDVYEKLYSDFYYFTKRLFTDTYLFPEDIVHDVFLNIWESNSKKFDNEIGLRLYVYVSIKNRFRNYLKKKGAEDRYNSKLNLNDLMFTQIVETETLSVISQVIDMLPEECAKVFKLHIDGWDVKDIALKLKKTESTIYKQKQESIKLIKSKIPNNKIFILILLMP